MAPLPPHLTALIAAATAAAARALPDPSRPHQPTDHSVAAAMQTVTGTIYTGVNIAHYLGGPCAESVAYGNALQAGVRSEDFRYVVAVGNRGRGVMNPCGRCRQMLLDYWPWVKTVVRMEGEGEDEEGLGVVGVGELLPWAFVGIGTGVGMKAIEE